MKHLCDCGGPFVKIFRLQIQNAILVLWQCVLCKKVEASK